MSHLQITDNSKHTLSKEEKINLDNLRIIADVEIDNLSVDGKSKLLVFPNDLHYYGDEIGKKCILSLSGEQITTNNIMGFVGVNDTKISIHSRFAKSDSEDYFLHYMLQKVFSINLFDLKTDTSREEIFDFLLYLFPHYLAKALRQGVFKKYQRFEHNDANIKGPIDISRHIRQNIPFRGTVAYNTRERTCDNDITQLIRHTIEYIKTKPVGQAVLRNNADTQSNVSQIVAATPTYAQNQRQQIVHKNLRPLNHPYFTEYVFLQKLCLQILRREELKFGKEKDKIYGILFDGAWLWEEYLYTVLKDCGFKHPQNKIGDGGIRMFENADHENYFDKCYKRIYPDFYKKNVILDAKYKRLNGKVSRDDLYQVVTYMHCMECKQGGYIYPNEIENQDVKTYQLAGYGGEISVIPFHVPQSAENMNDFVKNIKESENDLKTSL